MASTKDHDYLFKIVLVGDSNVGKSSLLLRFTDNIFRQEEDSNSTTAVDTKSRLFPDLVKDKVVKVNLWDTAGQERFRTITQGFYRGSSGVLLVFDIMSQSSFEHLQDWMGDIKKYTTNSIPVVIVGNKSDLADTRVVSREEAESYAASQNILYIETSAKDGKNVEQAFLSLINRILEYNKIVSLSNSSGSTSSTSNSNNNNNNSNNNSNGKDMSSSDYSGKVM